jgi:hypothetical protein
MLRLSVYGRLLVASSMFLSPVSIFAQSEEEGSSIQFAPEEDAASSDEESDMIYKDEDDAAVAKPTTPAPKVKPIPAPVTTTPAPTTPAPTTQSPAVSEEPKETLDLTGGRRDVLFGSYRVRVGLARPDFEKLLYYDKLYGDEDLFPTISADWFFWDWYATMGLSFRTGFYTASGKAAKEIEKPLQDITADDVQKDPNSKTNLTVIPLQIALTAEITPLRQKWLVVDGYIGFESLYFQEVRNSPDAKASSTALIQTPAATEKETDEDDALTNKGTKQLTVLGFSANILLNGLDGASANSMRGTMGLANIYLSPFMEYSRALNTSPSNGEKISKNPDFSRTTMGIGFTFESVK